MQFSLSTIGDTLAVASKPLEHDGIPPLASLRISLRPRLRNRERYALALALVYKPWIAERFTPVDACSPMVARAIAGLFAPRDVVVDTTIGKMELIPTGSRTALISDEGPATLACRALLDDDLVVRLANDQTNSSAVSIRQISMVSNAKHLMRDIRMVDPIVLLGMLMFYAEDYDIRKVILPITDSQQRQDIDFEALTRACRSVNIEPIMPLLGRSDAEIMELAGSKRQVGQFCRDFRPDRGSITDYPEIAALGLGA
jgi:hypothetical protein